jgi:hypothetical protein
MRNGPKGAQRWDVERQRASRLGGQRQPARSPDGAQRWDVERQHARNLDEQRQSTQLDTHALDVACACDPRRK